ncbi:MAG: SGNH/GDSL hydrolase family protein [Acidobacteriota bacterium]|nr:SGNH/GDSL hydrolase family protein [Acidobacteriota bacterium]
MHIRNITVVSLLLCIFSFALPDSHAATPDHWVGTWAASPVAILNDKAEYGSADVTLREIVHVSLAGAAVRIVLSNEFGLDPLTIGAAHIALSRGAGDIDLSSASALTFSGRASVTIPPGALVISDPAELKVPAFADLAISLFVPVQPMQQISGHSYADQTSYVADGNVVALKTLAGPRTTTSWPFLKGVDVRASGNSASVVAFGDSITDGAASTRNANARWPDVLARRLQADKKTANLGVLNQGIGGNRVLHDRSGPSALARFDRDVLAQAGVKYLIIMEGINDIGNATSPSNPRDPITTEDLIAGLSQLATRAHTHGIRVFGATLTPYVGAGYQSPEGETIRQAVNNWIRTTSQFDGVIDFDKTTTDRTHPGMLLPLDDSGDHLHPGDAGYQSMGQSIDLKLFTK